MKLRKLLAIMSPFTYIEILSIYNTDSVLYQGTVDNVPFSLSECNICINEETVDFCHICAETLVVYIKD